jgi:hypothetical protein
MLWSKIVHVMLTRNKSRLDSLLLLGVCVCVYMCVFVCVYVCVCMCVIQASHSL